SDGNPVDKVVISAPAKVNLFLQVLRRREDSYHDIFSQFQAVSLFDRLVIRKTDNSNLQIKASGPHSAVTPTDDSNLVAKAWFLMKERYSLDGNLSIELEKNIPVAAGLAGGSSDAASVIEAVDRIYTLGLNRSELAGAGLEIGSDLPFFFGAGQAIISGRGEIVEDIEAVTDYWLVLVTPRLQISTARAYADLKMDLTNSKDPFSLPRCRSLDELVEMIGQFGNDFEQAQFLAYPELGEIRDWLLECGALMSRMSGSGPTMFGLFDSPQDGIEDRLSSRGDWFISTVRPITLPIDFDS
ncbi:MAG: 4-(cytidine 5'-diphospho)-2-C-methyl-D-erythritol kinase, partial [candidate division Zixibacteria bacterium]